MGFSPLADMRRRIPDVGRSSPRQSRVSGFTIHHNAGVDAYGQATAPGREVSANYWITNDGVVLPNVEEDRRAWTTGASGYPAGAESDHRNITVEVSNSPEGVRTGTWAISREARSALARLVGDVFRRYNLGPVRRAATGGVAVHRDFVPTECPGPYIMQHLAAIIAEAEQYRTGKAPATTQKNWEDTMKPFNGRSTRKSKQRLAPNVDERIRHTDAGVTTIAKGPGDIVGLTATLRLKGTPGKRVEVALYREQWTQKKGFHSTSQLGGVRGVFDSLGLLEVQVGGSGYLKKEHIITVSAHAAADAGTVTVESLTWNGYARPA